MWIPNRCAHNAWSLQKNRLSLTVPHRRRSLFVQRLSAAVQFSLRRCRSRNARTSPCGDGPRFGPRLSPECRADIYGRQGADAAMGPAQGIDVTSSPPTVRGGRAQTGEVPCLAPSRGKVGSPRRERIEQAVIVRSWRSLLAGPPGRTASRFPGSHATGGYDRLAQLDTPRAPRSQACAYRSFSDARSGCRPRSRPRLRHDGLGF